MRPQLKVSNLISLQDARSSAAVGFDLVSFSLERGSVKKLSPALIWNIVQWLSGPEVVLEMNRISLEELEEVQKLFAWRYITLPWEEWAENVLPQPQAVILRGDRFVDPEKITSYVEAATQNGHELKVQLSLPAASDALPYARVAEHLFLHFERLTELENFLQSAAYMPHGISLGEEAEEEPGVLHYERIDDLMELLEEQFPV